MNKKSKRTILSLAEIFAWKKAWENCQYCKGEDFSDKTDTCVNCGAPRAKIEDFDRDAREDE